MDVTTMLLISAIIGLVVGLLVVSSLRSQIKTAKAQSSAANYVDKGSFMLTMNRDYFLYSTTSRRKIETNNNKK